MILVSRTEWQARSPKVITPGILRGASTCHWNGPAINIGGKYTWDHSICASLVRGIQNFHMDTQRWNDIAYNFLVCPHGYVFEGRGLNQVNAANGTNEDNRNSHTIMCLAGEENPFSDVEKRAFRDCVKYIADNTDAPFECVGHKDHIQTDCPGDARYSWVHQGMPIKGGSVLTPDQEANMAKVANAVGFCVLGNDDLVVTDKDGAIFHFDADGSPDPIDYAGAYNADPSLDDLPGPGGRQCIGVYAIGIDGMARSNGHPEAVGYAQVFDDSARYRWLKK